MSSQLLRSCGLILIMTITAVPLIATTVPKMELAQLVSTADSIVQGRVDSVESRWEDKLAYTYVSITVDDPLKGERRRTVMVRQLGGKIGSLNVTVAGMPKFEPGTQVIVFLKSQQNGTFDVVGLSQGKYEIVDDYAIANVSGLTLLDPKTGQLTDAGFVEKAPLETFKAKIRGLLQ